MPFPAAREKCHDSVFFLLRASAAIRKYAFTEAAEAVSEADGGAGEGPDRGPRGNSRRIGRVHQTGLVVRFNFVSCSLNLLYEKGYAGGLVVSTRSKHIGSLGLSGPMM
jgi:hypothetical protein